MINIEENYVGGGSIASSTSAVNYVDIPMSLLTTSSYNPASFNTCLHLKMTPNSNGRRLKLQLLDGSNSLTYFTYQNTYTYTNALNAAYSGYVSEVDLGVLPVYNKTGFDGANIQFYISSPNAWSASASNMIRVDTHFYYSTYIVQTQGCITPYYNSAPVTVSALRFFYDNTSNANVGTYTLYAGV